MFHYWPELLLYFLFFLLSRCFLDGLFALGNWFLALQTIVVALQIANGDLRIHLKASSVFFVVQVPLIYWAAITYGVFGIGVAWVVMRAIFFFSVTPLVHKTFVKGLHLSWLIRDVQPVFFIQLIVGGLLSSLVINQNIFNGHFLECPLRRRVGWIQSHIQ